jgi:hypothetical protein
MGQSSPSCNAGTPSHWYAGQVSLRRFDRTRGSQKGEFRVWLSNFADVRPYRLQIRIIQGHQFEILGVANREGFFQQCPRRFQVAKLARVTSEVVRNRWFFWKSLLRLLQDGLCCDKPATSTTPGGTGELSHQAELFGSVSRKILAYRLPCRLFCFGRISLKPCRKRLLLQFCR